MTDIKIGTMVRVIGSSFCHCLPYGSTGEVVGILGDDVYDILGVDEDGLPVEQTLKRSSFEVIAPTTLQTKKDYFARMQSSNYAASLRLEGVRVEEEDKELADIPPPKNHYELLDELATLIGVAGDESTEARWNDEIYKRRVLRRAIDLIKALSNKP